MQANIHKFQQQVCYASITYTVCKHKTMGSIQIAILVPHLWVKTMCSIQIASFGQKRSAAFKSPSLGQNNRQHSNRHIWDKTIDSIQIAIFGPKQSISFESPSLGQNDRQHSNRHLWATAAYLGIPSYRISRPSATSLHRAPAVGIFKIKSKCVLKNIFKDPGYKSVVCVLHV